MLNPRLAGRYAKSLIDLAKEKNALEEVHKDMLFMKEATKNNEFVALLRSPVIKADKKIKIVDAITKGKVSPITAAFNKLLIEKSRESTLPEIITSFINQYKQFKEIYSVKLTTATPVSNDVKNEIVQKVKEQTGLKNIELIEKVDEDIIGGFKLELGDTLIDATISYDLNKVKSQFLDNEFIYKIR